MKFLILFSMLIIFAGIIPASLAQEIVINTNKDSFKGGDTLDISGKVDGGKAGDLVALEIKDPKGETILIRSVTLGEDGTYSLKFKLPQSAAAGKYDIVANANVDGNVLTQTKEITQSSQQTPPTTKGGGGCLIATATYGTELAPQVQQLRELRDNTLLDTESGSAFIKGFNEFYYSFSPTIADMERQSPAFKEAVRLAITPMISSLAILNYVDMDSEASVLGYGIAIISLNIGMYFAAPAFVAYKIAKRKTS